MLSQIRISDCLYRTLERFSGPALMYRGPVPSTRMRSSVRRDMRSKSAASDEMRNIIVGSVTVAPGKSEPKDSALPSFAQ